MASPVSQNAPRGVAECGIARRGGWKPVPIGIAAPVSRPRVPATARPIGASPAAVAAAFLWSGTACAGPEPDAGYKLVVLFVAAAGLVIAHACALGFLARSAGRRFWPWCFVQLAATGFALAALRSVLLAWQAAPDMSALDLLLTDLVFETWSPSNLLLLAAWVAFSVPTLALALLVVLAPARPSDFRPLSRTGGPRQR